MHHPRTPGLWRRGPGPRRRWLLHAGLLLACSTTGEVAAEPPPEDLLARAGRDLSPLMRLLNAPTVPWEPGPQEDGRQLFARFQAATVRALAESHPTLAEEVGRPPATWAPDLRNLLVWGYLVRAYHQALPRTLQELVSLPTVAQGEALEVEPAAWRLFGDRVEQLCKAWGLRASRLEQGRVLAISTTLAAPARARPVTLVAVADTAPASPEGWKAPPFAGEVRDRRLVGRGAVTKGGLVAALYALRAIQDAGLKLPAPVQLLVVGTGERGRQRQVPLLPAKLLGPRHFIAVGAFPVTIGERGQARLRIGAPPDTVATLPLEGSPGFKLLGITRQPATPGDPQGWLAARLDPRDTPPGRAATVIRRGLTLWAGQQSAWTGEVREEGDGTLRLELRPEAGALPPLLSLLGGELGVFPDSRGRLARFLAERVTAGPDGSRLGLQLTHPRFPPTELQVLSWQEDGTGEAWAELDVSWPPGLELPQLRERITAAADELARAYRGTLRVSGHGASPHLLDSADPTSRSLLLSYTEATRQEGLPLTAPRASAAKGLKTAPIFGPLGPNATWDPTQVNEELSVEQLLLAARLYTVALQNLAAGR